MVLKSPVTVAAIPVAWDIKLMESATILGSVASASALFSAASVSVIKEAHDALAVFSASLGLGLAITDTLAALNWFLLLYSILYNM